MGFRLLSSESVSHFVCLPTTFNGQMEPARRPIAVQNSSIARSIPTEAAVTVRTTAAASEAVCWRYGTCATIAAAVAIRATGTRINSHARNPVMTLLSSRRLGRPGTPGDGAPAHRLKSWGDSESFYALG